MAKYWMVESLEFKWPDMEGPHLRIEDIEDAEGIPDLVQDQGEDEAAQDHEDDHQAEAVQDQIAKVPEEGLDRVPGVMINVQNLQANQDLVLNLKLQLMKAVLNCC